MSNTSVNQEIKEITVSAVVIRKDGTREDQGVVARYDRDTPKNNVGKVIIERFKGLMSND